MLTLIYPGHTQSDIAKWYRKHGFIEDALRCAPQRDIEFRASCLLALVRVFMKTKRKEIEEFHAKKKPQQQLSANRLATEGSYRDTRTKQQQQEECEVGTVDSTCDGFDDAERQASEEKARAFEAERSVACSRLDEVINLRNVRELKYAAEALLLLGVLLHNPDRVVTGLGMFRRQLINIGRVEGVHILMSWKPKPHLHSLKVCRIVAEAVSETFQIIEALVQPRKTKYEDQAEHCRAFYVVRRLPPADGSTRYRPVVSEGTRVEGVGKEKNVSWTEATLHQSVVVDLFKKVGQWPEVVGAFVQRDISHKVQCAHHAVGCDCPRRESGGQDRCVNVHLPYNSTRYMSVIDGIVTMLMMGGCIATTHQRFAVVDKTTKDALGLAWYNWTSS
jgi:hypothetical protein